MASDSAWAGKPPSGSLDWGEADIIRVGLRWDGKWRVTQSPQPYINFPSQSIDGEALHEISGAPCFNDELQGCWLSSSLIPGRLPGSSFRIRAGAHSPRRIMSITRCFASGLHGEGDATILLPAIFACRRAYLTGFTVTDDLKLICGNLRGNQSGAHCVGTLDAQGKVELD